MTTMTMLGRSLWRETAQLTRSHAPLRSSLQTDVAVVGAGITGLTTALLLQREGRRVAVLESDHIGAGTTGDTSALVTSVPELRHAQLIERLGLAGALAFVRGCEEALDTMESLQGCSIIPSGWARVPAYLFTESHDDVDLLGKEAQAARELGVAATLTTTVPLPFPVAGAVHYPDQARFHPVDYLQGLASQFVQDGGRIFEGTRVAGFEELRDSVVLDTDGGRVRAGTAILATHAPLGFDPTRIGVAPCLSYAIVLELKERLPDALFWDTTMPYHYFRRCDAGRQLLLLGGEDREAWQDPDPVERYTHLEEFARSRFLVRAVVFRWAAPYYEPDDGLPCIERSPLAGNVFMATGYSGTGLVTATLAARGLTDMLQGRSSEVARVLETARAGGPGNRTLTG